MPTINIDLKPSLYTKQKNAIFCEERYAFIEASTKSGKTLGCMEWLVQKACEVGNGANYWWVAPVFKQARIAYLRTKRSLLQFKEYGFEFKDADQRIIFPNGAIISYLSGDDSDNLYGEDVRAAVIDEASRVKRESFNAVRTTLTSTNGMLRCIGNVKGKGNWFYELCRKSQQGLFRNSKYSILTAYDAAEAGVLKYEEIEDAKAILPEDVFKELYLAIPSDDGGNPFGLGHIDRCISPLVDDVPIIYGLDLAKSKDYTVLIGLNRFGYVCYFNRWKSDWETTINLVTEITAGTRLIVDATGVGDPIAERLQKNAVEKGYEAANIEAFKFSASSKQELMENLSISIQKNNIHFPEGDIAEELRIFEYVKTGNGIKYSAPVGFHDDCVCSLALANKGLVAVEKIDFDTDEIEATGNRESLTGDFGIVSSTENMDIAFLKDESDYDLEELTMYTTTSKWRV